MEVGVRQGCQGGLRNELEKKRMNVLLVPRLLGQASIRTGLGTKREQKTLFPVSSRGPNTKHETLTHSECSVRASYMVELELLS